MVLPARRAARRVTMSRARSTVEAVPLPCHRRQATGRHIGRVRNGRCTTTPTITQRWPKASLLRPGADPSWIQDAPWTFFPRRRWAVSSTARTTGTSGSRRWVTTRSRTTRPTASIDHTAPAKNRWTRSWDHLWASPAPASIPQTVLAPVWAIIPTIIAVNTTNEGAVKHSAKASTNDAAKQVGSSPEASADHFRLPTVVQAPSMLLLFHPKITHPSSPRVSPQPGYPSVKTSKVERCGWRLLTGQQRGDGGRVDASGDGLGQQV